MFIPDMSDAATVTQLIVKHRHGVAAYLYGVVPDYHAVEDLFQEVSLVAIQKAAEFRDGTNFVGWMRAIARNKIREHLRRRSGVTLDDAFFDGLDQAFDAAGGAIDPDQRKEALRQCLAELQEESRRILAWRYEDGLTPAGIADRSGRTRAGVNSLLQRIRETLRDCVERRSAEARA
jgi:RNA polymerase sigma-70 factor, ECF subfamily